MGHIVYGMHMQKRYKTWTNYSPIYVNWLPPGRGFFFTWGGRDRRLCEEIFLGCLRFIIVNIQSKAPGKDALVLRSIHGPKGPPTLATASHQPGWAPGVPSTHCSLLLEGTGHLELRHPASSLQEQPSGVCKPQSSMFWDGSPHRG